MWERITLRKGKDGQKPSDMSNEKTRMTQGHKDKEIVLRKLGRLLQNKSTKRLLRKAHDFLTSVS